jgi:hypothetical protein
MRSTLIDGVTEPGLSRQIIELLNGLFLKSPKTRWTVEAALAHLESGGDITSRGVRYGSELYGNCSAFKLSKWCTDSFASSIPPPSPQDILGTSPNRASGLMGFYPAANATGTNRYRLEWEEVEFLVSFTVILFDPLIWLKLLRAEVVSAK